MIVTSLEPREAAEKTQAQFPHLLVLADESRGLSNALGIVHPHSGHNGGDTSAPTTIITDETGTVRWLYRPTHVISRLSPDEVLEAIDASSH